MRVCTKIIDKARANCGKWGNVLCTGEASWRGLADQDEVDEES